MKNLRKNPGFPVDTAEFPRAFTVINFSMKNSQKNSQKNSGFPVGTAVPS